MPLWSAKHSSRFRSPFHWCFLQFCVAFLCQDTNFSTVLPSIILLQKAAFLYHGKAITARFSFPSAFPVRAAFAVRYFHGEYRFPREIFRKSGFSFPLSAHWDSLLKARKVDHSDVQRAQELQILCKA